MLGLTGGAMAQLRIERLLSAQLILDLAAVAAGLVPGLEAVVGVMDPVGCSLLPVLNGLLVLALCLAGIHFLSFDLSHGELTASLGGPSAKKLG